MRTRVRSGLPLILTSTDQTVDRTICVGHTLTFEALLGWPRYISVVVGVLPDQFSFVPRLTGAGSDDFNGMSSTFG
ncbi:hypothetical protein CXB35_10540 [Pseudomonas syringae]|nr:hypothetical protein CXB35_10540 [Pseudomonas syringae]